MKKVVILFLLFICVSAKASLAVPTAPVLSLTTTGVNESISWAVVPGTTGYKLFYAPYPYTGPETIGSIDMRTQTNLSGDLWDGSAFYVEIKAYGAGGESNFSNIEYFVIPPTKVGVFYYPWYGNPSVNELVAQNQVKDGFLAAEQW